MDILHSEYISRHRYFTARKDAYRLASGKVVDPYFVVEMPPSATAMALTEKDEIILVSQYRHPVGKVLYELPGGFLEPEENPTLAIQRELTEETGYRFTSVEPLGITAANPGVLSNYTHLFLARGGVCVEEQQLDPQEEIQLHLFSPDQVWEMLLRGDISQSMHALCLFLGFRALGRSY